MTDSLEILRHRIDSATELSSVVRTMKALAASSITQYERAVESLDDYYRTVELGLMASLRQTESVLSPTSRPSAGMCAVVFGSDQGLVGQFNEVLVDFALQQLRALPGDKRIIAIGERVQGHFADAALSVVGSQSVPNSVAAITATIAHLLATLEAQREEGRVMPVYLFHNRPQSAALYAPVMQRLLPLDETWQHGLADLKWPTANLPEVLGESAATLDALIREYLFISLFRACAESLASENASRLAAMQRAEKNIDELLDGYKQDFQRQRQSGIDSELFDVLAGFEALSREAGAVAR